MKLINTPAELGNIKPIQSYSNSASSQRSRLLEYFSKCSRLTTMQARNELGILHPSGRILEMRRLGYKIDTLWVHSPDSNDVNHRIGMFVFQGIDWEGLEKRLLKSHETHEPSIDERYELLKSEIACRHLTVKQYEAAIRSLCKFLNY